MVDTVVAVGTAAEETVVVVGSTVAVVALVAVAIVAVDILGLVAVASFIPLSTLHYQFLRSVITAGSLLSMTSPSGIVTINRHRA